MTKMGSGAKLGGAIAVLALMINVSGCGTEAEGETESVTSALASNVPYLSGSIKVDNGTTGDAVLFNGKAYFAYIHNQQLTMVVENDLTNDGRQNPTTYAIPTSYAVGIGPGLVVTPDNTLYLFFETPSISVMWVKTSTDGITWSPSVTVQGGTWVTPPAVVAWDGQPVVFAGFQTNCCGTQIGQFTWSGTSFPPFVNEWPSSGSRPTATVWQGALYLAWNSGGTIFTQHFTDSAGWSPLTSLVAKSGIPALKPLANGSMQLIFRGNDSHIYHASTTDGVSYGNSTEDTASTTNHAAIPFINWGAAANWVFYVGVDNELFTRLEQE